MEQKKELKLLKSLYRREGRLTRIHPLQDDIMNDDIRSMQIPVESAAVDQCIHKIPNNTRATDRFGDNTRTEPR
ncbi:unnamed protein product [Acanthocheilonema viteae]|uniref:Uncharacterized protein n=1 Tax=Acanthocheilonema viteae TaxID=6277 RepID=A0A498S3C5_ACAVI|nr:unnamed protein product [Acanthocheilonema viteae]